MSRITERFSTPDAFLDAVVAFWASDEAWQPSLTDHQLAFAACPVCRSEPRERPSERWPLLVERRSESWRLIALCSCSQDAIIAALAPTEAAA